MAAGSTTPAGASPAPQLRLSLHPERFEAGHALEQWQEHLAADPAEAPAATALFIGRVRGQAAGGRPLEALELEHYPGMTERQLHTLARACAERHGVAAVLVQHRVGRVLPGEAIVLVAVAADRRGPAQRCCQELLEALKHEAPFWKREWGGGVGTWVQGNTVF
ncbi:MAG: molybdenum cofactor biosynthesis protein MoaE [Cyanobacteriota bacterium]|nr:molybdenum cofactor biosynthesis protein MoaE [Cyanobacteriota bacterium]